MNNKITFPRLATMLADHSGRSKRFSEDFLRELFSLISERLEAGDSVKVKGFGTFRLLRVEPRKSVDVTTGMPMEISGHSKVVFIPAKELADAVNAPFEAFAAVEIGDGVDIEGIVDADDILVQEEEEEILLQSAPSSAGKVADIPDNDTVEIATESDMPKEDELQMDVQEVDGSEQEKRNKDELLTDMREVDSPEPEMQKTDDSVIDDSGKEDSGHMQDEDPSYEDSATFSGEEKAGWKKYLIIAASCLVVLLAGCLVWWIIPEDKPAECDGYTATVADAAGTDVGEALHIDLDQAAAPGEDSAGNAAYAESETASDPVPTGASDIIATDTIGTSRFLTTMAKSHYGNNKLWPYIYEENKSHIGHPDRIRPGTPIVIPKLSKYGVDPKNPQDIERAVKLGTEIYARYGKAI